MVVLGGMLFALLGIVIVQGITGWGSAKMKRITAMLFGLVCVAMIVATVIVRVHDGDAARLLDETGSALAASVIGAVVCLGWMLSAKKRDRQ